jgi:hypothetical protein
LFIINFKEQKLPFMDEIKKQTNFEINQVISQPYKYGFKTEIEMIIFSSIINRPISSITDFITFV